MRILVFLFLAPFTLRAQLAFESIAFPVTDNELLAQPWAGGLNSVLVNKLDVDGDGVEDLVLLERTTNKVLVHVAKADHYEYAPDLNGLFPSDVRNFLFLRDFNSDGLLDLFTARPAGIKVYLNTTQADSPLTWSHFPFPTPSGGTSEVVLTSGVSGNKVNLQLHADDVPSIEDIDGDGDVDILVIDFGGSGKIEFHENMGTTSAPDFVQVTQAWGGLTECDCGVFAFGNSSCDTGGRVRHDGGKFLLTMDVNGDAAVDLFFSESECDQLHLLINEGTTDAPVFTTSSVVEGIEAIYPTAFFLDADFDGIKDLVVSTGLFERVDEATDFGNSLRLLKNQGTNSNLLLSTSSPFLQPTMIDVGENAVPCFEDADGDGDLDLFVGSFGKLRGTVFAGAISLYENKGSVAAPAFELITEDFAAISSWELHNIKPQFADINADGNTDLVFTATNDESDTKLYYVLNSSPASITLSEVPVEADLPLFFNENVHVCELSGDGLPDLLVGRANGSVAYWRNTGTSSSPDWTQESDAFMQLTSSSARQNPSVFVGDADGDGSDDLLLSNHLGELQVLSDFRSKADFIEAEREMLLNRVTREYQAYNQGGHLWPVVATLAADGPHVVIGNVLGGLHLFKSVSSSNPFFAYPNPAVHSQPLSIEATAEGRLEMYTSTGQLAMALAVTKGLTQVALPPFPAGVYLLRFRSAHRTHVQRLLVSGG